MAGFDPYAFLGRNNDIESGSRKETIKSTPLFEDVPEETTEPSSPQQAGALPPANNNWRAALGMAPAAPDSWERVVGNAMTGGVAQLTGMGANVVRKLSPDGSAINKMATGVKEDMDLLGLVAPKTDVEQNPKSASDWGKAITGATLRMAPASMAALGGTALAAPALAAVGLPAAAATLTGSALSIGGLFGVSQAQDVEDQGSQAIKDSEIKLGRSLTDEQKATVKSHFGWQNQLGQAATETGGEMAGQILGPAKYLLPKSIRNSLFKDALTESVKSIASGKGQIAKGILEWAKSAGWEMGTEVTQGGVEAAASRHARNKAMAEIGVPLDINQSTGREITPAEDARSTVQDAILGTLGMSLLGIGGAGHQVAQNQKLASLMKDKNTPMAVKEEIVRDLAHGLLDENGKPANTDAEALFTQLERKADAMIGAYLRQRAASGDESAQGDLSDLRSSIHGRFGRTKGGALGAMDNDTDLTGSATEAAEPEVVVDSEAMQPEDIVALHQQQAEKAMQGEPSMEGAIEPPVERGAVNPDSTMQSVIPPMEAFAAQLQEIQANPQDPNYAKNLSEITKKMRATIAANKLQVDLEKEQIQSEPVAPQPMTRGSFVAEQPGATVTDAQTALFDSIRAQAAQIASDPNTTLKEKFDAHQIMVKAAKNEQVIPAPVAEVIAPPVEPAKPAEKMEPPSAKSAAVIKNAHDTVLRAEVDGKTTVEIEKILKLSREFDPERAKEIEAYLKTKEKPSPPKTLAEGVAVLKKMKPAKVAAPVVEAPVKVKTAKPVVEKVVEVAPVASAKAMPTKIAEKAEPVVGKPSEEAPFQAKTGLDKAALKAKIQEVNDEIEMHQDDIADANDESIPQKERIGAGERKQAERALGIAIKRKEALVAQLAQAQKDKDGVHFSLSEKAPQSKPERIITLSRRAAEVTHAAKRLQHGVPGLQVFRNESELGDEYGHVSSRINAEGSAGRVEGFFDAKSGNIVVFTDNIASRQRLEEVAKHELAHRGLKKVLGDKIGGALQDIYVAHKEAVDRIFIDRDRTINTHEAVEEFISETGEKFKHTLPFQKLFSKARAILRDKGFTVAWSPADIMALAGQSIDAGKKGGKDAAGSDVRFAFPGVITKTDAGYAIERTDGKDGIAMYPTEELARQQLKQRDQLWDAGVAFSKSKKVDKNADRSKVKANKATKTNLEVAPNPQAEPEINALWEKSSVDNRYKATREVFDTLYPKAAKLVGLLEGRDFSVEYRNGAFLGDTNPSITVSYKRHVPFSKRRRMGKLLGHTLKQQSVITFDTSMQTEGRQRMHIFIKAKEGMTTQEFSDLHNALLGDEDAGVVSAGATHYGDTLNVANVGHDFSTEEYPIDLVPDSEFRSRMEKALDRLDPDDSKYTIRFETFRTEVDKQGEHYGTHSHADEAGGSGTDNGSERVNNWNELQAETQAHFRRVIGGQESSSTRFSRRNGSGDQADLSGGQGANERGLPLRGDGRVQLTHWGKVGGLDSLDPAKHGTGISGAEAKRKKNDPANYVDRTYHGLMGGEGEYKKEPGLGSHRYDSSLHPDELYDYVKDPDGLRAQAKEGMSTNISLYEKLIKEAGYAGFEVKNDQLGHVAATFNNHPVEAYANEAAESRLSLAPKERNSSLEGSWGKSLIKVDFTGKGKMVDMPAKAALDLMDRKSDRFEKLNGCLG